MRAGLVHKVPLHRHAGGCCAKAVHVKRPSPRPPTRPPTPEPRGSAVLVLTADPVLARHLLSVLAAIGLAADEPVADDAVRRSWRSAGAVLVGQDRAERVAELSLPGRGDVYVVGHDDDRPQAYAWSSRLRAAVLTLPGGAPDLAEALSALVDDGGRGGVLALVGGSGGVGTTTLAAALALSGARSGLRTLLVDADLVGGGIDVLLGAEHLSGWRWDRFESARGHLGDLTGQLPHCDGVDVLTVDRSSPVSTALRPEQVVAVVGSASRSHDLTVVDLPRHLDPGHDEVLRRASEVLLVVRADVRGVAAADLVARGLVPRCRELGVVVRTGRGHALDATLVADALELPLAGVLEEDPAIAAAAERGDPPVRSPRSALVRLCARLLDERVGVPV